MAGDWIKMEHATIEKPEVVAMADLLEKSPEEVFGMLFHVWVWFDKQSRDGNAGSNAGSVTGNALMRYIDHLVRRPGFAACMKQVGWLTDNGLPNFERHNGKSAKKRALTSERADRFRNAKDNASVTLDALLEKRREEKKETTPAPETQAPVDNFPPAGVVSADAVNNPKPGNIGSLGAVALDSLRVTPSVGSDQHEASGMIWAVLKANGCKGTASHPAVIEMARSGVSGDDVRRAIAEARKSNEGQLSPAYIAAIVERLKTAPIRNGKASAWTTDDAALEKKAGELGVKAKPGESYSDLRGRVREAVQKQAERTVQ